MHYRTGTVGLLLLLTACSHGTQQASAAVAPEVEGDGHSCEAPIVVRAKSDRAATRWEYQWLREHFPKHGPVRQALTHRQGRMYDELSFTTVDGADAYVCFDITHTFGT